MCGTDKCLINVSYYYDHMCEAEVHVSFFNMSLREYTDWHVFSKNSNTEKKKYFPNL